MDIAVLTFDEATHTYFVNGVRVPSVTQVLAAAGLRDLSGIPQVALENKRELGQLVHEATELDAFGKLDESTVDDQVWPYLRSWRKFCSDTNARILTAERRVDHPLYGYAGRLDHEVIVSGVAGILDKKTGSPNPSDRLQLAAYEAARNSGRRDHTLYRWDLYLRPNETYQLIEYTGKADFTVFLAALQIWKWRASNER